MWYPHDTYADISTSLFSSVPVGQEEPTKRNWNEYYVRSIKQTFGFGEEPAGASLPAVHKTCADLVAFEI